MGDEVTPTAAPSNYGEYESIDWMRDTNIDRQNRQRVAALVRPSVASIYTTLHLGSPC